MGFDMLNQSLFVLANFWALVACNLFDFMLLVVVDMGGMIPDTIKYLTFCLTL